MLLLLLLVEITGEKTEYVLESECLYVESESQGKKK